LPEVTFAEPFNASPVPHEKALPKLIEQAVLDSIVYEAVATGLAVSPDAIANALIVVLALTRIAEL
jgi:hypothetical protein